MGPEPRHSLELTLKSVCRALAEGDILNAMPPLNHDIQEYWNVLNNLSVGDFEFRTLLADISTYVQSLSQIDDDGQALRVGIIKTAKKSASCDASGHESDVGDEEPGDGAFEGMLPIFGKAA